MSVRLNTNKKQLSRERVISISFVDILIQAIFVLLVLLYVGYIDPKQRLLIESQAQAGRDFCNKNFPNDPVKCQQVLKQVTEEYKSTSNLRPCLPTKSVNAPPFSLQFRIKGANEIEFIRFTPEYLSYLKSTNQVERLSEALNLKPQIMTLNGIKERFSFVSEDNCYHTASLPASPELSVGLVTPIRSSIYSMFRAKQDTVNN